MAEPRCIVQVAGETVLPEHIIQSNVTNTLYMAASSFDLTLTNDDLKSDWFRKKQQVKIFYGYVKNPSKWYLDELDHQFTGLIDGVQPGWDKQQGETVELIGRDYSGPMIDSQFSLAFANRTASQIVLIYAKKYNLTPLITPTTDIITADVYQDKKEWEILQTLAAREGFVCYVTKDLELYFGPRQESDDTVVDTLSVKGLRKSAGSIKFDDSSVGVYNQIRVMHFYKKQLIEAVATNQQLVTSMGGQVVEKVMTDAKAKTQALAQQIADNYLHEYSRQAITATISDAPGSPFYVAEKKIQLVDAGRFSGLYYLEEVDHKFSKQDGYTVDMTVTNIRPDDAGQYKEDLYNKKKYDSSSTGLGKGQI